MSRCNLPDPENILTTSAASSIRHPKIVEAKCPGDSSEGIHDDNDLEEDGCITWSRMPEVVLNHIASYLSVWDKVAMARVCRKWYGAVMDSPSLWRLAEVKIRGNWRDANELEYIRYRGRFLKDLSIVGCLRCQRHAKKFQRTFTSIFAILYRHRVQLQDLTVTDLQLQHYFRGTSGGLARRGLLRSLRRYIRQQRKLCRLDLSFNSMTKEEGLIVLESVSQNSPQNIVNTLNIVDFFQNCAEVHKAMDFISILSQFQHLRTLQLNYSCISDELLKMFASRPSCVKLETLDIRCPRADVSSHSIHYSSWREFGIAFPAIRVKIQISGLLRISDVQRILVSDIPLHSLIMHGHNDDTFHPDRTLRHLARNYKTVIRKIIIDVSPSYRFFNQGLVSLVKDCSKLQFLELRGRVHWPTLRDIFEGQDEQFFRHRKVPPLKFFHLIVSSYSSDGYEEEATVYEEYRQKFNDLNLDYELIVEPQFYPLPVEYNDADEDFEVQILGPPILIDD